MIEARLARGADLAGFRRAVRRLVAADAPPDAVVWSEEPTLFGTAAEEAGPAVVLPRALAGLIGLVVCHRDAGRHALLYAAIWRVLHGEPHLLDMASDPLVHRLARMAAAVRREIHKMHAFVRFSRTETAEGPRFVAWFEPEHFVLEAAAGFFVERFRGMDWAILTPIGSLRRDGGRLSHGPPASRGEAPDGDPFEAGWRGYYESAFNPARVNLAQTRAEMPRRYWRNLPETAGIAEMVRSAPARARAMIERKAAMPAHRTPDKALAAMAGQAPRSLAELNRIIAAAPPMLEGGTRAVLGEGPAGAAIAFVGEQPGDQEDVLGRPFVGPAGQLFDRALAEAGIDRGAAYVTNAVKHFKYVQRGKRRLHQRPTAGEVKHYRWWLKAELDLVAPRVVVALGATAVLALAGRSMPVGANRGPTRFDDRQGYVTVHPSYLLRLPGADEKARAFEAFRDDLARIRALAA